MTFGNCHRFRGIHRAFVCKVNFSTHHHDRDVPGGFPQDIHPRVNMVEGVRIRGIEHEDAAIRALTITREQEAESLLAAKIPDLQLDFLPGVCDVFNVKFHTNRYPRVVPKQTRHVPLR